MILTVPKVWLRLSLFVVCLASGLALFWPQTQQAPKMKYTLLSGEVKTIADYLDKVVLVNFWATSCSTCVAEMPKLISTFDRYSPQGFRILAISMMYDRPNYVSQFVRSRRLPFDVVLDAQGQAALNWGNIRVTPTSFLLDKRGNIVHRFSGPPDLKKLHTLIEKYLAS